MATRTSSNLIARIRPCLGYAIYTLVLLVGFIYFLFPYQKLQYWAEREVGRRLGVQIRTEQREAGPFWFAWKGLSVLSTKPFPFNRLYFPELEINFLVRSLVSKPYRFTSSLKVWEGHGEGELWFLRDSTGDAFRLVHSLSNAHVSHLGLPYVIDGQFSLDADYRWNENRPSAGDGHGTFSVKSIKIKEVPLSTDFSMSLTISSASGMLSMHENELTFRGFRVQGEGFNFSGDGKLLVASDILDSQMEAEGILYVSQNFMKQFPENKTLMADSQEPISVKLTGTFHSLSMQLNGLIVPLEPSVLFTQMVPYS